MAAIVVADTGFLVALLNRRDARNGWATMQGAHHAPPWHTCEAVLSEAFHLLGPIGRSSLEELLRLRALNVTFAFAQEQERVLALMKKYSEVPMDFADACLVRMTEAISDPVVLTTDSDFRIYRRHGRQVIPCALPL